VVSTEGGMDIETVAHDTPEKMYAHAGLDADGIVATALGALGRGAEVVHLAGKLA